MISSSLYLILLVFGVAALGGLLYWALSRRNRALESSELEVPGGHAIYLAQIRQALDPADFAFVKSKAAPKIGRAVRKARTKVALGYLVALQTDFQRMLRLARVIAALSPEIAPAQEWERLRLSISFAAKLELTRIRLRLGFVALPQLQRVNRLVSGFAIRLEHAMAEMGERAALASEMASFMNGG